MPSHYVPTDHALNLLGNVTTPHPLNPKSTESSSETGNTHFYQTYPNTWYPLNIHGSKWLGTSWMTQKIIT